MERTTDHETHEKCDVMGIEYDDDDEIYDISRYEKDGKDLLI